MNKFMELALNEAKKAYSKKEVPVGAIIVKNDIVIAKAHNLREQKHTSLAHAEILAIEKACKKLKSWRLEGCTMYVTLEPCLMCAGAITQSRIDKVVIGALDDKNGVIKSIANVFEDIHTTTRVEYEIQNEEECSNILTKFFKELRNKKK